MRSASATELASVKPGKAFSLAIHPLTRQTATAEEWVAAAAGNAASTMIPANSHAVHLGMDTRRGNRFVGEFGRVMLTAKHVLPKGKWVHVAGVADPDKNTLSLYVDGRRVAGDVVGRRTSDAELVTQAYALQRWVNACAGRLADVVMDGEER